MYNKSRPSSGDQSRIPMMTKKRSTSMSKNESEDKNRLSMQPRQSVSVSRQQGSLCYSASNQRVPGLKDIKEVRPLSEKFYQDKMKSELRRFLIEKNLQEKYLKCLTNPSCSDFKVILEFLGSWVGICDDFSRNKKVEEALPDFLLVLGYPVSVPKRNFLSIGVQHTWPVLLAILDFMRIVAEYDNCTKYEEILDGSHYSDQETFKHELKTYCLFMSGQDDFSEELEELEQNIVKDKNVGKENETLERELYSFQRKLEAVNHAATEYTKKMEYYKDSRDKISTCDNSLDGHIASQTIEIERLEKEINGLKNQALSVDKEIGKLSLETENREDEVKRQGQLGFDVHKLDSEFRKVKMENCDLEKENNNFKSMVENQRKFSAELVEKIKQVMKEFHQSKEFTSFLRREEEEFILRLHLIVDGDPRHTQSLEELVNRIYLQASEEQKKMAEYLRGHDLNKKEQTTSEWEKKVREKNEMIKGFERETCETKRMQEERVKEMMEMCSNFKLEDEKRANSLQNVINQEQATLEEVERLSCFCEEEKKQLLEGIKMATKVSMQGIQSTKNLYKRYEEMKNEDIKRISEDILRYEKKR